MGENWEGAGFAEVSYHYRINESDLINSSYKVTLRLIISLLIRNYELFIGYFCYIYLYKTVLQGMPYKN